MANFKACVRRPRSDGFWQVYIRVTHHRGLGYIKTDKVVTKKELTNTSEIKDAFVLSYCADLIIRYNNLLNTVDAEEWTVNQIIEFLTTESQDICFSDYARIHINRMINSGHERTSKNYKYAVENLERYIGSNKLMFGQLTSAVLKKWIESLRNTNRAKEVYPINAKEVIRLLYAYKAVGVLTITTDNGSEFSQHRLISKALKGVTVYFADPYASWQKELVEYTNKLIRQDRKSVV